MGTPNNHPDPMIARYLIGVGHGSAVRRVETIRSPAWMSI